MFVYIMCIVSRLQSSTVYVSLKSSSSENILVFALFKEFFLYKKLAFV